MTLHTIVAVYDNTADAQSTIRDLEAAGIDRNAIETHAGTALEAETERVETHESEGSGFLGWLFGKETPDPDRAVYRDSLGRGGSVVSVRAEEEDYDAVVAIVERNNPVDVDERGTALGYVAPTTMPTYAVTPAEGRRADTDEDTIQLSEEQMDVGKRTVQGGKLRVRTRVIETPVTEDVNLRDERVSLERRAVSGAAMPGTDPFAQKTIDLTETREEAVVGKTVRVVEEVVVGKDVHDRTETVTDTVRRQEIDVDRVDAAGEVVPGPAATGKPRI